MAHRTKIQDLAKAAGVSVSSIDRILNGRDKVRASTAAKVLAAAEELQFYALPLLRDRLQADRPRMRVGVLLQQSHRPFYRSIAEMLRSVAAESPDHVEVLIEHMDDLSPEAVAERMLALGRQVGALAVVSAQHARIAHAIEILAGEGVPTYGLISELSASCDVGYVGLDNWRVGRTAAWTVTGLCRKLGPVAILIGNHRYRCQELNEVGFRSYFREHAPEFTLLEPVQTFEDKTIARDVTEQLLTREPGLVGIYVAGGGLSGVLDAIRESGRARQVITVSNDITEHTRLGLFDNTLSMAFAHPLPQLANELIALMARDIRNPSAGRTKRVLRFDVVTPENV